MKLQVHIIDMSSTGCRITTVHPIIFDHKDVNPRIRSIRAIPIFNFEEFHHNANHVVVVVDTESAGVIMWKFDVRTVQSQSTSSLCSVHEPNLPSVVAIKQQLSLNGLGFLLSLFPSSSNLVKLGGDITMVGDSYLFYAKLIVLFSCCKKMVKMQMFSRLMSLLFIRRSSWLIHILIQ